MELEEAKKHLRILKIGIGYLNFLAPEEDKDLVDIEAIDTVLKELDRLKSLDIYKLIEDYETGQLIPKEKIETTLDLVATVLGDKYELDYQEIQDVIAEVITKIRKELLNKE